MLPFRKILCPTDFSDLADGALKAAIEMANQFHAELYLMHVVHVVTPTAAFPTTVGKFDSEIEQFQREEATDKLHTLITQRVPPTIATHVIVRSGDTTLEILRVAEQEHVDLIVMATHGTNGWRCLITDSVAEDEVRLAACPVLVVHAPRTDSPTSA